MHRSHAVDDDGTDAFERRLAGRRALVVASLGSLLDQAIRWSRRMHLADDSVFVTFDDPHARAVLAGQAVSYLDHVRPRDWRGAARAALLLWRLVPPRDPEIVISTGAAVALAVWPAAYRYKIPMHYIESVARVSGPSLTGRILRLLPGVETWTQHDYGLRGWRQAPSLLGDYRSEPVSAARVDIDRPLRILVSVGVIRPYRFDRLVESVLAVLGPDDEVTWQLGSTDRTDLPGRTVPWLDPLQVAELAGGVDVVIADGAVGVLLDVLEAGRLPIVVDRRMRDAEHVDDHQREIAELLEGRALAIRGDAGLTRGDLLRAAAWRVVREAPQEAAPV
ncbi:hypothetical protein [Homoserinibacter sp. GY 40078]|uniref:hypothetical protein n=1 Tax=Homoserinibacter sp. GY 40078 TaxID=2603275 RepID=UPI0011CBE4EF|nr:hypothetical protein [Homoserinibacter sp. GY 40078]TXK18997.1 hypothetical protein FVQ89_03440 [Homoserinibacter sp. GY 40078]